MLQLKNATPFAASLIVLPDAAGIDTIYAVVKATFAIEPPLRVAEEQTAVAFADKYYEDPLATSIEVPSDVCLGKPGTDVLLVGSAWAPNDAPTWQSDVSLRVGPVAKSVRVYGDRVWEAGPAGASISWVAP